MTEESADIVRIRFEVEDTGVGIREEVREKIFETFSQADSSTTRRFGGTGLGLTLCRQLTHLMDGGIGVESEEGKGSTFWFDVSFTPEGPSLHDQTFSDGQLKSMSLLVVDRNDTSTEALKAYFEHYLVRLDVVSDSEGFYATLESKVSSGGGYDGVIINLAVGFEEACRIIVSEDVQCCIKPSQILLTGSLNDRNRAKEDKVLMNYRFLVKPLRRRYVRECILMLQGLNEELNNVEPIVIRMPAGVKKILVVEDNRINQQVAQGRLESMGFTVSLAANGEEALTLLEQKEFDLVFMDCQMPVLDGFQATRRFRKKEVAGSRTPVIAMTAHVMAGDREACMRAGMDDYIAKPFKTAEIIKIMERWIGD
ncbi:MAG: response regulator [Pseudomonadales bacterium]|nr:response regulator [Pseudomonadales bacterium]